MKDAIYLNEIAGAEPTDYANLLDQLGWLSDELSKLKRKRKKKKRSKRKGKKRKIKKINRRIRKIENEMEQVVCFVRLMELQPRRLQSNLWWQNALVNSLPQFFEFATATVNRLPVKKQQQLYLTDKQQSN